MKPISSNLVVKYGIPLAVAASIIAGGFAIWRMRNSLPQPDEGPKPSEALPQEAPVYPQEGVLFDATHVPSRTTLEGCVRIGDLPPGRQTTWSALGKLFDDNDLPFDPESKESIELVHRLGDDEPYTIIRAINEDPKVFDADSWCANSGEIK